jgi:hypothetical protein
MKTLASKECFTAFPHTGRAQLCLRTPERREIKLLQIDVRGQNRERLDCNTQRVRSFRAFAEGDMVATRCSVRGKHAGDSLGFAATQAPVDFTGVVITRIKDGKIVEAWNHFDFMRMYEQLGVI